ncbi:MAG: hypothetical protein PHX08_24745 [Lachnospiraceae bacterium]|nr:hypothetical protein [Lachnospiraceae bacterium]
MKYRTLLFIILISFFLSSCSSKSNFSTSSTAAQSQANISAWDKTNISPQDMLTPQLIQNALFYWNGTWNNENKQWQNPHICLQ